MAKYQGTVLVVDDNESIREPLMILLELQGHQVAAARNGQIALEMVSKQEYDLILLDIMMPEMDGYDVLTCLKQDPQTRHIPVVMLTAVDDIDSVVRCINLGAEDYLFKPFNKVLLKARVDASLEKKRWRDQEKAYLRQIEIEREKAERLLLNILPAPITERLKQGESVIADSFDEVTVLFADIVDFTPLAGGLTPAETVELLNKIFTQFDELADQFDLEKIKTIGDAYMVVAGVPTPQPHHCRAIANMALAMQESVRYFNQAENMSLSLRIGISSGPVVAGVIGRKKFAYDLWGDTVNTAHRMESHGVQDCIQVCEKVYAQLRDEYDFEARGLIAIKGKPEMPAFILRRRNPAPSLMMPTFSHQHR